MDMTIFNDQYCDALYEAAVQSVEESVVNAMVAGRDMGGTKWDRCLVKAIDHTALQDLMKQYGKLPIQGSVKAG